MSRLCMKGVSVFITLLIYGTVFLIGHTSSTVNTILYNIVFPIVVSDYLGMIFIITVSYTVSYRSLIYVHQNKKRRGA